MLQNRCSPPALCALPCLPFLCAGLLWYKKVVGYYSKELTEEFLSAMLIEATG